MREREDGAWGRIQNRLCVQTKPALLIKVSENSGLPPPKKKREKEKNLITDFEQKSKSGLGVGFAVILKYSS